MVPSKWGICSECAHGRYIEVESQERDERVILYCPVRRCRATADKSCPDFLPFGGVVGGFDEIARPLGQASGDEGEKRHEISNYDRA